MVALDQMDRGGLDPKFVAGLLASPRSGLKRRRHRGSSAAILTGRLHLAGVLGERLSDRLSPADASRARAPAGPICTGGSDPAAAGSPPARLPCAVAPPRRSSLQAMAWSNLKAGPCRASGSTRSQRAGGRPSHARTGTPAVATLRALPSQGKGRRFARPPAEDRRRPKERGRPAARRPRRRAGRTGQTRSRAVHILVKPARSAIGPWPTERPRPTCWRGPGYNRAARARSRSCCGPPGRSRSTGCWPPSSNRPTSHWA